MLNLLQEYARKVLKIKVNYSNLTSCVKDKVQEFLRNSKRICDKYKKIISVKDCYSVATIKENKNTLFLILGIES